MDLANKNAHKISCAGERISPLLNHRDVNIEKWNL